MKAVLNDDFRYLLSTFHYTPNEEFSGPPRNVPVKLVESLFGKFYSSFFLSWEDEKGSREILLVISI